MQILLLLTGLFVPCDGAFIDTSTPTGETEDVSYMLQGEYQGLILPVGQTARYRQVGVQVVALGKNEFQASVFQFGLPGDGWDKSQRETMQGTFNGEKLELSGETYRARVVNGQLKLFSVDGSLLGVFPRRIRKSPTLSKPAPHDAIVLFDGTSVAAFQNGQMTADGLLKEGTRLRDLYSNFHLHVEFRLPYMPDSRGQKRANSGLYLLSRYELQILDSFGLEGKFNECGAIYRYQPPAVNMCFPPLQWQTYDIDFQSAVFAADGTKTQNARITVRHNGTLIHDDFELERKTGAGAKEGPNPLPIKFQNHRDPVRFRNIWIIDRSPRH